MIMPTRIGVVGMVAVCLASFATIAVPARATTMRAYSMEELVAESDLVVIGTAIHIAHHKNTRGKIVRSVDFSVSQYIVGKGPSQIVLELAGGRIGNVRTVVFGESDLVLNERVLLFIRRSLKPEERIYYPVGMGQGRFHVVTEEHTGEGFVTQVVDGRPRLVDEIDDDPMGIGRSGVCIFVSLERFVARIRKILGITESPAVE
jgi:hypothetical protein